MGRLSRTLLLVPFVVGCGRLGFDGLGSESPEPGGNTTIGVEQTPALAPYECESVSSFAILGAADVDLSVATTPDGASVFWVPTAGGSLRGFDIAASDRSASPITLVRSGPFDQSSAAFIDGRLIATVRSGLRALVHDVPTPIAAGTEIANLWGDHTAKTAVVHASVDRVMAASCSDVALHTFDAGWTGTEDAYLKSSPSESDHLDIAQVGTDAFTVVSLATGCSYTLATDRSTGTTRTSPVTCSQARATEVAGQVALAVETATTVDLVVDAPDTVTAANAMPIGLGSSPRVMSVNGRLWLSYLADDGALTVGYVDAGIVRTTTLTNLTADHDAYELAVLDGSPWVIGVDPQTTSVYGRRLCAPGT